MDYMKDKAVFSRVYMEAGGQQVEYETLYAFFVVFYVDGEPAFFADFWVEGSEANVPAVKRRLRWIYDDAITFGEAENEISMRLFNEATRKYEFVPGKIMTAREFPVKKRKTYEHAFSL